MLTFVGLGLWDERSVTIAGRDAIRDADRRFVEWYTSRLFGSSVDDLESYHDASFEVRDREGVEQDPSPILRAAADGDAVFLTAGDPMISTTHVDLRLRAIDRGIETSVIHGTTAQTAASSLTGLQNYRFGKATTLPFPRNGETLGVPDSVVGTIEENKARGLHTLVYLDINAAEAEYMAADTAARLLAAEYDGTALGVVVARAGSPDPLVRGDRLDSLQSEGFGGPLHLLVIPGTLHHIEASALARIAGVPEDLLPEDR